MGLVTEVVPADDLPARALAWAERLAAGAPLAVRDTKAAVNAQLKRALLESFDLSMALELPLFLSGRPRGGAGRAPGEAPAPLRGPLTGRRRRRGRDRAGVGYVARPDRERSQEDLIHGRDQAGGQPRPHLR